MKFGRYEVIKELGQGGMATAYLAIAPGGEKVVLKTPHLKSDDLNERLRDEARIGIRLAHPALVETLDLFEHDGKPVLVVAFIDGVSVDSLRRKTALTPASVARIGWQIAQGLHAVHCATDETGRALHMVHRDVTAPNVLVDKSGDARLIDLGIARSVENLAATEPGTIKGTVRYLAPELLQGLPPTPQSDLWGLGCVMYEAATGKPIHEGAPAQTMISILRTHPLDKPEAKALHPRLLECLKVIFERDYTKRIGDGYELAELLQRAEAELGDGEAELSSAVIELAGEHGEDRIAAAQAGAVVDINKLPMVSGVALSPSAPSMPSAPHPVAPGAAQAMAVPAPISTSMSSRPNLIAPGPGAVMAGHVPGSTALPPSPFSPRPLTGSMVSPFAAQPGGASPSVASGPFARSPTTSSSAYPASFAPPPGTGSFPSTPPGSSLQLPGSTAPAAPELPRPEPRWAVASQNATGAAQMPPAALPQMPPPGGGPAPITSPTPLPGFAVSGVPNPFGAPVAIDVEARPRKSTVVPKVPTQASNTLDHGAPIVVFAKKVLLYAAVAIALGLAWRFVVKPAIKAREQGKTAQVSPAALSPIDNMSPAANESRCGESRS